jgi:hypothetical protein
VHGDTDGDGKLAWEEYWTGMSPTNSAEVFRINEFLPEAANTFTLRWLNTSNATYSVYKSTNLVSGWLPALTNNMPAAASGTNEFIDPAVGSPRAFYRIVITP